MNDYRLFLGSFFLGCFFQLSIAPSLPNLPISQFIKNLPSPLIQTSKGDSPKRSVFGV